jgi:putative monooxygenase
MSNVPFVKAADVQGEYRTPPRVSKLLLAPKFGGVKNVSMGMNITEVGSMIPDHVHDESEEVLFLISGRAKIVIEGREWRSAETALLPLSASTASKTWRRAIRRWVYCPPLPRTALTQNRKGEDIMFEGS